MELNEYQKEAAKIAFYEHDDIAYCALGITGEAGEIADHVKKMLRDDKGELTNEREQQLVKELGDVLWYVARMAGKLGYDLDIIAIRNLEKIQDRLKRNVQHGSGDNR
jgi:NTP pyrophosphatase (non-canonical NTP hydrolase)